MMSDETKAQEAQEQTPQEASNTPDLPEWVKDPSKAYSEIKNAREEAKSHRVKALELEQRLKAIEEAERKKAESEAIKKGDFESLLKQREAELEELRRQVSNERINSLKMRIGAEMGLPAALIDRLTGANEEELRADAQTLKSIIPQADATPTGEKGSKTVVSPASGAKTGETYEQRVRRIYGSRRAGGNGTFG